jgi:hypothetical protein
MEVTPQVDRLAWTARLPFSGAFAITVPADAIGPPDQSRPAQPVQGRGEVPQRRYERVWQLPGCVGRCRHPVEVRADTNHASDEDLQTGTDALGKLYKIT